MVSHFLVNVNLSSLKEQRQGHFPDAVDFIFSFLNPRQVLSPNTSRFRSNQCTLTDPCHGGDLAVGLGLSQEGQCKIDLIRHELLRSAIFEVRVLPCHCLSCLRSSLFVLGKGKHDRRDKVACQGVLQQSHVQAVNPDPALEQFSEGKENIKLI